ncbi:MAG: toxin-antitoxin system HicB family antitoxin [Pirellulaceae bacterium]
MSKNAEELLESARNVAESTTAWADLSNFLFNPDDGLIVKAYPARREREAFLKTPEYRAIRSLLLEKMNQSGLAEGATPEKSGRFVVRLPKSLHAALEREAAREGVSLNQLVVAKLAVSLSHLQAGTS